MEFYGNLMQMNKNSSLISKIVQEMQEALKNSFADQVQLDSLTIDTISSFMIAGMLAVFQNCLIRTESNRLKSCPEPSAYFPCLD